MQQVHSTRGDTLRLLRLEEVERMTGLKKSVIYRLSRERSASGQPLFPRRRKIGARASAWVESEVQAWIEALPEA